MGILGWLALLALLSTVNSQLSTAWAQSYSLGWSTIDGGGGTSTGGVYAVTGTIGQPDAGAISGGNFTLQGGFWGLISAVQTPGAPQLWVARTTTNTVVVWWALSEVNWQLQATTNLSTSLNWTDIPPPYTTNSTMCLWTMPLAPGNNFYRLRKP
jgi:hypothetical protein